MISIDVVIYQLVPIVNISDGIEVSVERDEFPELKDVVAGGKDGVIDDMVE